MDETARAILWQLATADQRSRSASLRILLLAEAARRGWDVAARVQAYRARKAK